MAGFLRRLRRGKEAAPAADEEPPAEGTPAPEGSTGPEAPAPEDDAPPPATGAASGSASALAPPTAPATAPSSRPPIETGPPPPLPQPEEGAMPRILGGGPRAYRSCFLCGAKMDGPWCPTCRMVWND